MSDPAPQQNQITKRERTHIDVLADYLRVREKQLATYARNSVKPETMIRLALYESSKEKWMKDVAPETVYASLIIAAQLGLEPSGARGEAYLVPFKGKCTLMPGYRGLVKLALRSGAVKSIRSRIVYEGDEFLVEYGSTEKLHHVPKMDRVIAEGETPRIIAAYAIADLADGTQQFEVLDGWQLDKVRAASMQANGPAWQAWAEEMYRKAPVRRLAKYLPLGDDYFKAAAIDELQEAGKHDEVPGVIDVPSIEVTAVEQKSESRIAEAMDKGKAK